MRLPQPHGTIRLDEQNAFDLVQWAEGEPIACFSAETEGRLSPCVLAAGRDGGESQSFPLKRWWALVSGWREVGAAGGRRE